MQSRRKHKTQGTKWRAKVMQPCASTNRNWLATILRQSREKWEAFRQRHTEVSALLGCGPPQRCLARVVARPMEADEEEEEDVTAVEVEDDGGWLIAAVSISAAVSLALTFRKKTCASASFPVKGLSPDGFSASRPIT